MKNVEVVRESSNLKNKKGITLIALVITIIVLLILAGVSIATLTGENGILSRAKIAEEKKTEAEAQEKDRLSSYEDEIDNYNSRSEASKDEVIAALGRRIESLENTNTYSTTDEKVVGTYINGKNIYRKVFVFENDVALSRNWVDLIDVSSLNIEQIVNATYVPVQSESNSLLRPIIEPMLIDGYFKVELEGSYRSSYTIPKGSSYILEYTKTSNN